MFHPILFVGKGTDLALLNADGVLLVPMWLYPSALSPRELWNKVNSTWGKVLHKRSAGATAMRAYGGVETLFTRNRNGLWQIDRMIKWHLDNEQAIKLDPEKAKDPALYKHSRHSSARTPAAYVARLLQVGGTYDNGNYVSGRDEHSNVWFAWDAAKVLEYFLKLDRHFQKMNAVTVKKGTIQRPAHERWGVNQSTHFSDDTAAFGGGWHNIAKEADADITG